MKLKLSPNDRKTDVFSTVKDFLEHHGFTIINSDQSRPWGGFYVIDETQAEKFISFFFKHIAEAKSSQAGKLSPKILIVERNQKLSWQYHYRRAEIWKVIDGEVGVITSPNNEQGAIQLKRLNDIIILKQGERHRLVGTDGWGIIAEIWQHTDSTNPSNEDDIVRLQDEYGR